MDMAKSMNSCPVPLFSMKAPKITNSITYDADTPSVEPKMPSVERYTCSISTGSVDVREARGVGEERERRERQRPADDAARTFEHHQHRHHREELVRASMSSSM